jgi:hypothetical protein
MTVTFETRVPHDPRDHELLQCLDVPAVVLISEPIRINGRWFLPASKGQAEQLSSEWMDAKALSVQEH